MVLFVSGDARCSTSPTEPPGEEGEGETVTFLGVVGQASAKAFSQACSASMARFLWPRSVTRRSQYWGRCTLSLWEAACLGGGRRRRRQHGRAVAAKGGRKDVEVEKAREGTAVVSRDLAQGCSRREQQIRALCTRRDKPLRPPARRPRNNRYSRNLTLGPRTRSAWGQFFSFNQVAVCRSLENQPNTNPLCTTSTACPPLDPYAASMSAQ